MVSKRFVQLTLFASVACAFKDASPFFLFSTTTLPHIDSLPLQQVAKGSGINPSILTSLSDCPSDAYVVVSQPGASSLDFAEGKGALHLRKRLSKDHEDKIQSSYSVPDVLGTVDTSAIEQHLLNKCGAKSMHVDTKDYNFALTGDYPQYLKIDFPELPASTGQREVNLAMQDSFLNTILGELSGKSYIVVYTTTPPSDDVLASLQIENRPTAHEQLSWDPASDFIDPLHTELKRNMDDHIDKRKHDNDSDAALFEKYNFLSPGIFMGGIAFLILFLIFYAGITAVSGLQVSYAAFSKENGPAAQKKQQ